MHIAYRHIFYHTCIFCTHRPTDILTKVKWKKGVKMTGRWSEENAWIIDSSRTIFFTVTKEKGLVRRSKNFKNMYPPMDSWFDLISIFKESLGIKIIFLYFAPPSSSLVISAPSSLMNDFKESVRTRILLYSKFKVCANKKKFGRAYFSKYDHMDKLYGKKKVWLIFLIVKSLGTIFLKKSDGDDERERNYSFQQSRWKWWIEKLASARVDLLKEKYACNVAWVITIHHF